MPRLADVDELMRYLDLRDSARVDGQLLAAILEAAERFAEQYTGRRFSPDPDLDADPDADPVTKTYTVTTAGWVRVGDLRTATEVKLGGTTLTADIGYYLDPASTTEPATHIFIGGNVTSPFATIGFNQLAITGFWGFSPTPPDVKDAVLLIAARRWRERDAAYADSVALAEGGSLSYFRQLPPFAKAALDLYRVPRIALVNA